MGDGSVRKGAMFKLRVYVTTRDGRQHFLRNAGEFFTIN